MKSLTTVIMQLFNDRTSRVNITALVRFLGFIVLMVAIYSVIFHYIMEYEGRELSWVTGVYWTLTVMSTLGFGDITFNSDLGRIFSIIVLLSGVIFLLVLLPFTFIEFFYAPWMKAQQAARAPIELPERTSGHIVLTKFDTVTKALIEKLNQYHYSYVVIIPDLTEALQLHDLGYKVMRGDLDDPKTYYAARVGQALMVASTANDQLNANVAFTVREISDTVPIIATANREASVDLLELAGCSQVFQLAEMMGQRLARQVADGATVAQVIGQFDDLMIAEASVRGTALVGQTLAETRMRERTGLNVVGVWQRGQFQTAAPETRLSDNTILVMAGSRDQVSRYNDQFCNARSHTAPVLIIGGGRVGRAVGRSLTVRGIDYRIIEKDRERVRNPAKYVVGDGAELEILEEAGIRSTAAVIITTHDDDMNVYLTIYCRRLRPEAQIISRANLERNIPTLHRAGADFVMSYASTGSNAIINHIGRDNILMVAEGLDIFEVDIPPALVGKTLAEAEIRTKTGCTVIAIRTNGDIIPSPDPFAPLPAKGDLILIGVPEAEELFLKLYTG